MIKEDIFSTIKSVVHTYLPESRILLFGSRAKGNVNRNSDYDIIIVTNETFETKVKHAWKSKIHKTLVNVLELPFDILLNSEKEILYKKNLPGHLVRTIMKDAIEI